MKRSGGLVAFEFVLPTAKRSGGGLVAVLSEVPTAKRSGGVSCCVIRGTNSKEVWGG